MGAGAAAAGARVQGALYRADLHQVHQGQDCQGGGERDAVDGEREGEGGRPADPELKIVKQVHRWAYRLTSLGHQHWVCTSLGRSAPLPHTSYQDGGLVPVCWLCITPPKRTLRTSWL